MRSTRKIANSFKVAARVPKLARAAEASMPLRRIGEADEVAGAIVFLASPAGKYITGQKIVVDGGTLCATPALGD